MQQASLPCFIGERESALCAVPGIHEWGKLPGTDDAVLLTHGAARGRGSDNKTFKKGLFRPFKADSPLTYVFSMAI